MTFNPFVFHSTGHVANLLIILIVNGDLPLCLFKGCSTLSNEEKIGLKLAPYPLRLSVTGTGSKNMQFPQLCLEFRGQFGRNVRMSLFVNNFNNITCNFDACILNIQDYRKHVVADRIFICMLEKRRDKHFFLLHFFSDCSKFETLAGRHTTCLVVLAETRLFLKPRTTYNFWPARFRVFL